MDKHPPPSFAFYRARSRALEERWQELSARYLPVTQENSIWRYHRPRNSCEPARGWKLHIPATVLNAGSVLKKIAPFIADRGVQFKAPCSLTEVSKLNSGLYHGYLQVGKIITVYPRDDEEAVSLAHGLHKLTRHIAAPSVPFDLRFNASSNVYYRFGAFEHLEIEQNGQRIPALRDLGGELVPDLRENPKPDWVSDPFDGRRPRTRKQQIPNSSARSFLVFRALAQRGKGGVYQAVDLSVDPPRLCLVKEGRKNGEVTWDGRDGAWRVRNEERVLSLLLAKGVNVPLAYSSFEVDGNYYLVTEFVEGESLQDLLYRSQRRMRVSRVLQHGIQLASFFAQIHAAGWTWRDCKPLNIMVTPEGKLRPLDFEGACPVDQPDPMLWGTPGFTPPEWAKTERQTGTPDDLYALGSLLYLLLSGKVPKLSEPLPIEKLRRNVPFEIRKLVMRLLSPEPDRRPNAPEALSQLEWANWKASARCL